MRLVDHVFSRRAASLLAVAAVSSGRPAARAAELVFVEAGPKGFSYADAKPGKGVARQNGQRVTIDYVMSTTGARYGAKIDSTQDRQEPYSWTLGDGSTIEGLELAIKGGDGVPPMLPGGVRRVIIPSNLAYEELAKPNKNNLQIQDCSTGRGPIPPNSASGVSGSKNSGTDMGAGEFQREWRSCPRSAHGPLLILGSRR